MEKKTGFTKNICNGCAYCKKKKCTIAKTHIANIEKCPEGYTYELMREINEEINKRLMGLPHGDLFAREW